LLGIGVIAALIIGWQVAAFAVHNEGVFELDGNANNEAAAGDDWSNIFTPPNGATDTAFLEEEPADASSIFTGGGSKDPIDIPSWKWKDGGGLPDKDNLLHAFAASYTASDGDDLLYFGSDRFDNSGDAVQGFWFFQNEVTDQGTPSGTFTGTHKLGDLLVLSDFSNGGGTATIAVYEWNPGCTKAGQVVDGKTCGDANLLTLASSNTAKCVGTATTDNFCGIVSPGTITMPWTFNDKTPGGTANSALNGEFYEGGVNLTALGLGDRCFSSVASETRSSTSTTAVLKDFVIGGFGECTAGLHTTPVPAGPLSVGDTVQDSATLDVTGTATWTGTLKFFLCAPDELDADGLCSTGGTQVGSDLAIDQDTQQPILSDEATVDAPGTWCFRGEFTSPTSGVPSSTDATEGECFTVSQPSGIDTAQRWTPNDTATVSPAGTTGTVEFKLYANGTCSAPAIYTESDDTAPFATNNTTFRTDSTTVSWQATFTPTPGSNIDPSTGVCETTQVTLDNDGP
jgi:hypothetical protein